MSQRSKVLQLQPDYNVKAHDFADLAEQIVKALPADRYEVTAAFLRGALMQAQQLGIRAVPTFVLDGRLAVQGAQSPEVFRQAFAQVGRVPIAQFDTGAADACGPDGCAV